PRRRRRLKVTTKNQRAPSTPSLPTLKTLTLRPCACWSRSSSPKEENSIQLPKKKPGESAVKPHRAENYQDGSWRRPRPGGTASHVARQTSLRNSLGQSFRPLSMRLSACVFMWEKETLSRMRLFLNA